MAEEKYVPRLKTKYNNEVKQQLQDKFQYENVMMIPKFEKIVVNMGVGEAATDSKAIDGAVRDLRAITGQQPMITRARKSIATFRLRAGMPIGCKVTLRGDRMWEFFDRLTSVAIPRIRDFRGISAKSFDGRGNFSMGVTEQLIFPEIDFDSVDHQRGMDITFVTTANTPMRRPRPFWTPSVSRSRNRFTCPMSAVPRRGRRLGRTILYVRRI